MKPCPNCPDGNVWDSNGPTGKACPTCKGMGYLMLNGAADSFCECALEWDEEELGSGRCKACGGRILT